MSIPLSEDTSSSVEMESAQALKAIELYRQTTRSRETSALPTTTTAPAPIPAAVQSLPAMEQSKDVEMSDVPETAASPYVAPDAILPRGVTNGSTPIPTPARVGTPSRTNGNDSTSRATSVHPDPAPAVPKEAALHGAPLRQYINSKVTTVLLDGMKKVAREQPKDPLRMLGEYLLQMSKELEK